MPSARFYALSLAITLPALHGCKAPAAPCVQQQYSPQLAILRRQKDDLLYEMQLRQNEIDEMTMKVKGAVGVSNQWLERKSELIEKITELQVRAHDIDLQIADLSKAQ